MNVSITTSLLLISILATLFWICALLAVSFGIKCAILKLDTPFERWFTVEGNYHFRFFRFCGKRKIIWISFHIGEFKYPDWFREIQQCPMFLLWLHQHPTILNGTPADVINIWSQHSLTFNCAKKWFDAVHSLVECLRSNVW